MNNRDTEAAPAASTTSTPTPSNPTRVGSASRSCPNHPVRVVARTTGSSSGIAVACTSSAGITAARGSTTCGCSTSTRGHGLAYRSRPRLRPRGAVRWGAAPSWGGGGGDVGADGSNLGIAVAGRVGQPTSSSPSSSEGPSRRFGYVSVVHNNKFVLFGGFDGARWLNDMFEFDLGTKTWKRIEARGTLPSMRSCPAWAKDDRYVYIHGVSLAFRSGVALFHFHAFHSYTPPPPHP